MIQIAHAITNMDGSFVEADEAYCQMMQLTLTELCKRDILSVTYHADWGQNGSLPHRLLEHGTPFWVKKRYVRDDESLFWVLNHVTPIMGILGKARIAAASFILPPSIEGWSSDEPGSGKATTQTDLLNKLLG